MGMDFQNKFAAGNVFCKFPKSNANKAILPTATRADFACGIPPQLVPFPSAPCRPPRAAAADRGRSAETL